MLTMETEEDDIIAVAVGPLPIHLRVMFFFTKPTIVRTTTVISITPEAID